MARDEMHAETIDTETINVNSAAVENGPPEPLIRARPWGGTSDRGPDQRRRRPGSRVRPEHCACVSKAFVSVVHQTSFEPFDVGRIAAEERHGDGIPDLTIRDTDGMIRVLVENKFWSGLTDTQPVGYLDQLPSDAPAALLFVVPHRRLHIVWAELKERCATRKIELTDEAKTDDIAWSRTGNRILAITSWKHVLAQLQQAASAGGHDAIEQDIIQLRGLTDQENTAEFLPLREDEITSATLARRLLNYTSLIDEVVDRLVAAKLASIKNTGFQCDYMYPDHLARVGDWIIECATASELLARVRGDNTSGV